MREYIIHLKTIVFNKYYYICIFIATGLFFLSSVDYAGDDMFVSVYEIVFLETSRVQENSFVNSYEILLRSVPGIYATVFLPVLCILPGVFSFADEMEGGYNLFSVIRSSKIKYEITWLAAHATSAGMILALAYALFSLVLRLLQPSICEYSDEMAMYFREVFSSDYFVKRFFGLILFGFMIAVISFICLKIWRDKQITLAAIFSSVYLYTAILNRIIERYNNEGAYDQIGNIEKFMPSSLMNILAGSIVRDMLFCGLIILLVAMYCYLINRNKRI